jgi:hypothetical protein
MSIFERALFRKAELEKEQQEAGITPKEATNDNSSPLATLEAKRDELQQRIAASGEHATVEDRQMLADLEGRIGLLKQAA